MTTLTPLNSQSFFCRECGIGPANNCTAPHVVNDLRQPGTNQRAILILSLAIGAMVVAVGLFSAWRT